MITKGVIKKTLTTGILALMACTSMSAMAEKQWVRVDDYYVEFGCGYGELWGDAVICGALVACEKNFRHPSYQDMYWTGDITINNSYSKACIIEGYYMNLLFIPRCKVGTYSHDRPDGCYDFKEPNPVPPIEPNPYLCNMVNTYPYPPANVACIDDLRAPCIWNLPPEFTDDEAIARIRYCMREHEKVHIAIREDMGSYCNDKSQSDNPTNTQYTDEPNNFAGEMIAYEHSMACLENQRDQCNTKACYDQVENARQSDEKAIIIYGNLYNDWGKK